MAESGDRDRVREATDIVDLIGEVTKVKKSGRSFMAVCPFHEEKTPSMSVDRARGLYHCFGCGEGGDVFSFVQKTQAIGFPEALDFLARRAGITLTQDPDAAKRSGRRNDAVEAIRRAIDIYHDRLKTAPEAGPARAYLRGRGYDGDLIDGHIDQGAEVSRNRGQGTPRRRSQQTGEPWPLRRVPGPSHVPDSRCPW